MEDHHQNHPQYGIPHFSSDLFGFNIVPPPDQQHRVQFTDHEMGFFPRGVQRLTMAGNNSNTVVASTSGGGGAFGGFTEGGETGRWPRQETLMLLEVRSRLDHKFKEANQKGPLWDEVSRIMSEEHGYTRSGKKCREKFENLYKYYKKTKEGNSGRRQDGKNYRFFRQLEAICGESKDSTSCYNDPQFIMTNALHSFHEPSPNIHNMFSQHQKLLTNTQTLSLSNNVSTSELGLTSSTEENGSDRINRSHWKANIQEFIGAHMERLIEKQDAWLEKLMKTMEDKEHQRMVKEEEWRRVEAARINKERLFWAKERKRMEARDLAVIEALQYLTGKALVRPKSSGNGSDQTMTNADEENKKVMEKEQMNKKRKETWSSRGKCFSRTEKNVMTYNNQEIGIHRNNQYGENMNEQCDHVSCSSSNSKKGNRSRDIATENGTNCFPLLMGDGDQNLWEGYGLKAKERR